MEDRKPMKPELTAEMHSEFLEGEMPFEDVMVMKSWCSIQKGMPKAEAVNNAHITLEYYDLNVDRVLNS